MPIKSLLIALWILLAGPMAALGSEASYVRFESGVSSARVVIGLTERVSFRAFTLTGPPRVVLDFPALDWRADPPRSGPGKRLVTGLRFGVFRPGASRMVVDLSGPARIAAAFTEEAEGASPVRFVLELASEDAGVFEAGAGWPPDARPDGQAGQEGIAAAGPPIPRARPKRGVLIAIDPGHGGVDPGAVVEGLREKDLVLDYARALAERIEARPGFRALLIREDDRFLRLRDRVDMARKAGADALLSIHADALATGLASGASVYTLSEEATGEEAAALAASHNRADVIAGVRFDDAEDDVARVLVELAQKRTNARSDILADRLVSRLMASTEVLEGRARQSAGFRVLKAPDMPSVLIELGFLSSARDRARIASAAGRTAIVEAVAAGVVDWALGDARLAARLANQNE